MYILPQKSIKMKKKSIINLCLLLAIVINTREECLFSVKSSPKKAARKNQRIF